ncbi:DNA-processing protein DprA [candidate division WOR-3 bacterium]|nr:DNA-processing protein DprA [candidate division WOR-3 bacterium]
MERIRGWLQLLDAPDVGNATAVKLVKKFGDPNNFIGTSLTGFDDIGFVSNRAKEYLSKENNKESWENAFELIEHFNIKFVTYLDEEYPKLLRNIYDPPVILFYRGNLSAETLRRTIAIVGTRKASNYGLQMTSRFGKELVESGFTIVSGLAFGVDTRAHLVALENNGNTLAIMGTGVDQIYPACNRDLAERIIENGAIISEYLPGVKADPWNFPNRNRIISGCSLGTLVIEGSKKSGALLTAKFALQQNREVFALPGDINRQQAAGPNYLISLGGKLVSCTQDILDEFKLVMPETHIKFPHLNEMERKIYDVLIENKPEMQFDMLLIKLGFTVAQLSSLLLSMELKDVVKKLPGNKMMALM